MKPKYIFLIVLLIWQLSESSCKKLIEVSPPSTAVTGNAVFSSDATAIATLTGIYATISTSSTATAGSIPSLSLYPGLSSDELTLWSNSGNLQGTAYYQNALTSGLSGYGSDYWSGFYPIIFSCNAAIEGLKKGTGFTPSIQQQLLGEAYFMRAYCYFYLVNLYGDLPLALTSDYAVNSKLSRTSSSQVFKQIVSDFQQAVSLLSTTYFDGTLLKSSVERVRPTKWAAEAMLARAYLYTGNWSGAQAQADLLLNNNSLFALSSLDSTFLRAGLGNKEAIWQLQPVNAGSNTEDAKAFIMDSSYGPGGGGNFGAYLSSALLDSFELGDNRRFNQHWIDSVNFQSTIYYFPIKYKVYLPVPDPSDVTEYLMMLRLGETYLIRAEAKARQGDLSGAATDLNAIRARAGLSGTSETTQPGLIKAILHERQVELFTEMGQRWLDLKRTGSIDAVMGVVTPQKSNGASWNSYQQLYPVYYLDIQSDPNLKQNLGY